MKKRIFSLLMAVCMIFSFMPLPAFATQEGIDLPVAETVDGETPRTNINETTTTTEGITPPITENETPPITENETPPTANETVCTCPPVENGELVHAEGCPLYVTPQANEGITPPTADETVCTCTGKCTPADEQNGIPAVIDPNCPVCNAQNADLALCKGEAPVAVMKATPRTAGIWGGTGSLDDPYLINDVADLKLLATEINKGSSHSLEWFKLVNNITIPAGEWTPIGTASCPFKSNFDGNGKTVVLNMTAQTANDQGLFGYIFSNGTVRNVTVDGTVSGKENVGGVAGTNTGTIQNCHNKAKINGIGSAGGVVGFNYGTIKQCFNTGNVTGTSNCIGGVVGFNERNPTGLIKNCYNTGDVIGAENVAGVVGMNNTGTIESCYNTGTVTGTAKDGGIVGMNNSATLQNCVSLGLSVARSTGYGTDFGRVYALGNGTIVNNKARSDMLVCGSPKNGTLTNLHGADIAVDGSISQTAVFDSTDFKDTAIWKIPVGNLTSGGELPTLVGFTAQNPTLPNGKTDISNDITFADKTVTYNGDVQPHETATTASLTSDKFTYTYTAQSGSALESNGKPKGTGKYTVTASYDSATETGSKTANFTITAKPLTTATVTVGESNFTYTGLPQTPTVTVSDGATPLTVTTDYTVGYVGNTNAGTATATVTFTGNYTGTATATFNIAKALITISGGTVTAKDYDGDNNSTVTALVFDGLKNGETFAVTTDYTVGTPTFNTADAGQTKTVKGTAALVANDKTNNYALVNGGYTLNNCVINKVVYTAVPSPKIINIKNGAVRTGTITLSDIFGGTDKVPAGGAFGKVKLPIGNRIMKTVVKNSGGSIDYTSNNNASDEGRADIYKVNVTTTNYTDFDVNITFQAVNKTAVNITGLTAQTGLTYNGKQQNGFTGDAKVEGDKVLATDLVYTYTGTNGTTYNSTTAPTDAGSYTLTVAVKPNNADYTGSQAINFTIGKVPLTITATSYDIYQFKQAPDLTKSVNTLAYKGFVNNETKAVLTATYSAVYAKAVNTNNTGTTEINVGLSGTETNNNYAITLTKGLLTVHLASSGSVLPTLPATPATEPFVIAELADPANPNNQLRLIIANLMPSELAQAEIWLDSAFGTAYLMASHEVELQFSNDNGVTWRAATLADIKSGKVKAVLPVPANTSPLTHDLFVYHFAQGTDKPATKEPAVYDADSNSLVATITSFSPFVVVAVPKSAGKPVAPPTQSNNNNNANVIDHENNFWISVVALIQSAKKGDVLKIDTGAYSKMPACVMEELRIKGAGLIIKWNGGKDVVIPVGKAQGAEKNRDIWTLAQLAEMYKKYSFGKDLNKPNPNTGVSSYSITDSQTGITTPITGNIINANQTQVSQTGKFVLLMVAGTLVVAVTVFGINAWKKKHEEDEE